MCNNSTVTSSWIYLVFNATSQLLYTTSSSLLGHGPEHSHHKDVPSTNEYPAMKIESDNENSVPADLFALPVAVMTRPQYLLPFPFSISSLSSPPLPPPLSYV